MTRLIDLVLSKPINVWNWARLSMNPEILLQDIQDHPELPWVWERVSYNPNITIRFVADNLSLSWNWRSLSKRISIDEMLRTATSFSWDWGNACDNNTFTIKHLLDHPTPPSTWQRRTWNWSSLTRKIPFADIIANRDLPWDWRGNWISRNASVTLKNILDHPEIPWNWNLVSSYADITYVEVKNNPVLPWNWDKAAAKTGITLDDIEADPDRLKFWPAYSHSYRITYDEIQSRPDLPWKRANVVMNPSVTLDNILANPRLSRSGFAALNPNVTFEDIKNHPEIPWNWSTVSSKKWKGRFSTRVRAHKIKAIISKLQPLFIERKIVPLQRFVKARIYANIDFVMSQRKSDVWTSTV